MFDCALTCGLSATFAAVRQAAFSCASKPTSRHGLPCGKIVPFAHHLPLFLGLVPSNLATQVWVMKMDGR
jgi:hypothetical protein